MAELTLVSHMLCPYVQRAAIVLAEKNVAFDRVYVDLADKPDWFKRISPLGKVPLLRVRTGTEDAVIFESAVILEYLEETQPRPLHSADPLERARERGWIEFGSAQLNGIARLYNAETEAGFEAERQTLREGFERLEQDLSAREASPFFAGARFSLVDAVYGPIFRYFDVFEDRAGLRIFAGMPHLAGWRCALATRPSIQGAVDPTYPDLLSHFLLARKRVISTRMKTALTA